jgi:hypothetical protein
MSTAVEVTYEEYATGPCPWLPDQTFGEQNADAISDILEEVATDYPHTAATVDFDPAAFPQLPKEQRQDVWRLLMGRQHGVQDKSDGKVEVTPNREATYRRALGHIAIGPHSMMEEVAADPRKEYHMALLTAGTPYENHARLRSAKASDAKEVVALTGQRMRGMWPNIPGEGSVADLFVVTSQEAGMDATELKYYSPFVQAELEKSGRDWQAPFGTEYHLYRLAAEAEYAAQIDWKNYDETVIVQPLAGVNQEMRYYDGDQLVVVPPREEGAVTYHLMNGKQIHIVNGAALPRPHGAPRATSTSIAQEAMQYVPIPDDARLVAIAAAPHLRAAMDTAITYLDVARTTGQRIERMDVAASPWELRTTNIVAALGELVATTKADARLRAVLAGNDPNSSELMDI